jgi:hypothetical protein
LGIKRHHKQFSKNPQVRICCFLRWRWGKGFGTVAFSIFLIGFFSFTWDGVAVQLVSLWFDLLLLTPRRLVFVPARPYRR